jgi:phosphonate dehydrogenase
MPKIVVTNWVHPPVLERLAGLGEVDFNPTREPWSREETLRRAADADAVLAFMTERIDAAFLAACPRLRIVACALKGFDNFDVAACDAAGAWISIVPDLLTAPTAELAVGLAIGLGRRIREGDATMREGTFEGWRPELYGAGLDGATVAIVGMGQVGRAIARRLSGFGCRLLGVDPTFEGAQGIERADPDRALAAADFAIVAAPLTASTFHMIGGDAIRRMKPGALLVNVGRGSVVDEVAVADALADGRLGGYAADVFALEDMALPDRPRAIDRRLLDHPRTMFTPHLGSAVDAVRLSIADRCVDNIEDVLAGRPPRDAVNVARRASRSAA